MNKSILVGMLFLINIPTLSGQSPGIFREANQSQLNEEQLALLDVIKSRPTSGEVKLARVPENSFFGHSLQVRLNLSSAIDITADRHKLISRGPDNFSWLGRFATPGDFVSIVSSNNRLTGVAVVGRDRFRIEPLGDNFHAITLIDPSGYPPTHPAGYENGALEDDTEEIVSKDPTSGGGEVLVN